jgi:hypothetical protein
MVTVIGKLSSIVENVPPISMSQQTGMDMPTSSPKAELMVLAEALGDLRDSWVLISLVLKDQITETPSLALDEAMLLVEKHLARINGTP